jgi:hypothetical protein
MRAQVLATFAIELTLGIFVAHRACCVAILFFFGIFSAFCSRIPLASGFGFTGVQHLIPLRYMFLRI